MKIYRVYEDGERTTSQVCASTEKQALTKAIELNKKFKLYTGTLTVKPEKAG
ncbi:hypothetical protein [Elizabethkingia phage TCUEAP1]|nr:hypothetical protein [Elizabethkingia phage TCUEAP1]